MVTELLRTMSEDGEIYEVHALNGEEIADDAKNGHGSVARMYKSFYETDLSDTLVDDYGLDTINPATGKSNSDVILDEILPKLYPDGVVTLARFTDAVQTAINAGALERRPEPVRLPRVRDEAGQFANETDLEIRRLIETNPGEIKKRVSKSRAFADRVNAIMFPQAAPVVRPPADADLVRFADLYVAAASLRPIGGYITLGGERFSLAQFQERTEAAINAGLL